MRLLSTILFVVTLLCHLPMQASTADGSGDRETSGKIGSVLGPAYAATKVNTAIFRHHSVVTHADRQFTAYYGPDGLIVLGQRTLPDGSWTTHTTNWRGNVRDAHNSISMGVSGDGILHISYDHHGHPLRYRRTRTALDVTTFGTTEPMTADREKRVTYPEFVNLPGGDLLFFYRDGSSGSGDLCANQYATSSSKWTTLAHPLITGSGEYNPYWCRPAVADDGTIQLAWVWRRTGDASTNSRVCYARSRDCGISWKKTDGSKYQLPISPDTAEVIDPVPEKSNLSNQDSSEVDSRELHVVYRKNDGDGVPQFFHLLVDGKLKRLTQVTHFTQKYEMKGGGSLRNPLSRANLFIDRDDNVFMLYRDTRQKGYPRVVKLASPGYAVVADVPVIEENMRQWEPTFDVARYKGEGVLSLMLLSSDQGDHETVTQSGPELYRILDIRDPEALFSWKQNP